MNETQNLVDVVEGITLEEALKKYEPMVHRFVNTAHTNHVCSKEDLCQEGRMAIVIAFQNFDPEKNATLTTWVYHMIKSAILEYQKHNLSILSGGAYLQGILRKAGQDASVEEIMEFGVSKKTAIAARYIRESFSTVDYDDLSTMIGADDVEHNSLEAFDWKKYLTESEVFAVGNYFGFNGSRMTMGEIGEKMGRSRKSVSYLINRALVKLRRVEGIEDFAFV